MSWLLLVEDDEAAAALITQRLSSTPWHVERAATLHQTLARLEHTGSEPPAAVLLDLNLPDSEGFSTVAAVMGSSPHIPIVVVTGEVNDELRLQVVESGAQEFVLKSDLSELQVLVATAIARQRHRNHAIVRALGTTSRTDRDLDRDNPLLQRSNNARMPLADALPEVFDQFITRYIGLVGRSVEALSYKGQQRPTDEIREMARDLGVINCAPRDLIELHHAAAERAAATVHPERAVALAEESRVMLLELMGYLAMHYRDHAPFTFDTLPPR